MQTITARRGKTLAVTALASALVLATSASVGAVNERPAPAGDAVSADDHEIAQVTVNLTYPGGEPADSSCVYLISVDGVDLSTANTWRLIDDAASSMCDPSGGIYVLPTEILGDFVIFAGYDITSGPRHLEQFYTGVTHLHDAEVITLEQDDDVVIDYEVVMTPPAFTDVTPTHPFYPEIQYWAAHGIMKGYPDGSFKGGSAVTRQAVAAFLVRFLEWEEVGADGFDDLEGSSDFDDVSSGHPFFREIEILHALGLTEGYDDGTFRPTSRVSRQALAAFLYRIEELYDPEGFEEFETPEVATFSDVPTDHPFFREIEWLVDEEITTGYEDGTFRPSAPVTRQAIAAFLERY